MYITKRILIITILFTVLMSCKKEEKQEFTDSPIIEAYLEPGKILNVKISRQIPFSSDVVYSDDDVNHLAVNVTNNNTSHQLISLGNGQYVDSSLVVADGEVFNLSFTFNKKNVSAYTLIPGKPQNLTQSAFTYTITRFVSGTGQQGSGQSNGFTQPDPLTITWSNTDASYYLVVIENIETTLDPIRSFGNNSPPGNRFRKSPTTTSSIDIRALEFQYYGTHRIIIYHVLPDYASLYDASNSSSQNLSNPSTSVANGYGIFTGLDSDTLYVEVKEP